MPRRWLPVLIGALLAAGGCRPMVTLEPSTLRPVLGPEVDSVVVRPFEKAAQVPLNEADLARLTAHLREALVARQRLHAFDAPPTLLSNTVVLAGRLERFTVTERQGQGLLLRTIELGAEVRVLPPQGDVPRRVLHRELAWQRVYPGTVSGLPLDQELAMRELSNQLAQALAPDPGRHGERLWDGRDPRSGEGTSHAALLKGNRYAGAGMIDQAILAWQRVVFDPSLRVGTTLYQVTPDGLERLRNAGLDEATVARMEPLLKLTPRAFAEFRRALHAAVGGILPNEGLVLTTMDTHTASTHRNLAAAHANLAIVYELQGRDDLAAYHWAHAWAHQPAPLPLERWQALQARRELLPSSLSAQQALDLYLRIPAPSTAGVVPGDFERTVAPPSAFAKADAAPAGASPRVGAAAPPVGTPGPAAASEPAPTPAPAPTAEASTPGRAAGSGPSEPAGAPSGAPAPSAPAAQ